MHGNDENTTNHAILHVMSGDQSISQLYYLPHNSEKVKLTIKIPNTGLTIVSMFDTNTDVSTLPTLPVVD